MGEMAGQLVGGLMAKKGEGGGNKSQTGMPPGEGFFGGIASGAQGGQGSPGFFGGLAAGTAGAASQPWQAFMAPQQQQPMMLPAQPMPQAPNPMGNNFYSNPMPLNQQDAGMAYQAMARPDPTMQGPAPPMGGVSLKNKMLGMYRNLFPEGQ